jgi:trigger factor
VATIELIDDSSCKKTLIVEIPAEAVQKEFDRITREFARHARVPGFRPGKTPVGLIKKKFHEEIRNQLVRDLVPKYYEEALQDKKLKPVDEPHLDKIDFQEGGPLKFHAHLEVLPALDVQGYNDLKRTVQKRTVKDEDIQKSLESIQERHAKFIPIEDRVSRLGDFVTVNLAGKMEDESGVEFQDKNINIELGNADTVEGFTENLCGVKAGDHRDFHITYPSGFSNERLAGKKVLYQVEIIAVKEKQLPPLDNELAKEAGDFAGLEELKSEISKGLESAAERDYDSQLQKELLQQLLAANSFEIPEHLVDMELRGLLQRGADQMMHQGIDVQRAKIDWKALANENRPRAEERVRCNIALEAIADKEGLEVSEQEMDAELRRLADLAQKTPEALRATLAKDNRIEELNRQLRRQKALDLIRNRSVTV